MGSNGRPLSAIQAHPHGPVIRDGALIVQPGTDPLALKLDVLAVGMDVLVSTAQAQLAEQRRANDLAAQLVAGLADVADKLDRTATTLEGIKLPPFLTRGK